MSEVFVHPDAHVHPTAKLERGCWIGPAVYIDAGARIGAYSVIGGMPEHREFYSDVEQEKTLGVMVKPGARIFEFVTIHAGTAHATFVGTGAAVFNHSHLAHDCWVEDGATVAGHTSLAGHVHVMERAIVGGMSAVHQKCVIGALAIVSFGAMLKGHVPPGEKWIGWPARPAGLNEVGLHRAGLTAEECASLYNDRFNEWVGRSGL